MPFDLEAIRAQFPALALTDDGMRRIYFDNPGGTQVPRRVADAMTDCLLSKNANLGAYFATSKAADQIVQSAREAMSDFLNAASSDEIIFGQNMTTIALHLSRSIGRKLKAGDEIVLSTMDHDGNVGPWLLLAEDLGLEVRWLSFDTDTFEFDLGSLDGVITDKTRLVCVGGASNLTGTINDVNAICARAREVGAWTFIDGVQSAPHVATDVQAIGCDFFACSAYKFFGPHQGILWGRRELLEQLHPYKVRPAPSEIPWCFETGTQSIEGIAGIAATVAYFDDIGNTMADDYLDDWAHFSGRRQRLHAAMDLLFEVEKSLGESLLDGLAAIDGITIHGITAPDAMDRRVPTVSFTHEAVPAAKIAAKMAEQNIFVWSGDFYAVELIRRLGTTSAAAGGVLRIGPVHYNSVAEIDETMAALRSIVSH